MAVHGDDFMAIGKFEDLVWMRNCMGASLEVKSNIIGPGSNLNKQITLLNRTLTWTDRGLTWEADGKHAETIIKELGLEGATGVAAPCMEEIRNLGDERKQSWPVSEKDATKYRSIVARANYLASDRADAQYTVRMLSKGMASPTAADYRHLRHFGRYLIRMPHLVQLFPWGVDASAVIVQTDSDWAGDKESRKSTSGGQYISVED